MKPERWREIEGLYHAVLELNPDERNDYLDRACEGDEALRREIESLLAFDKRAENFIEAPALEVAAGMLAKDQALFETGSSIGPYQILSLVGAGGMGKVYLAQDTRLGRKIALKVLPKEFTQDPDRVRRFEQEARAASALNHPNIITIFEIGRLADAHYIATEFIEGQTLRQRMKQSRIELRQALDIACQIVSAIAAAHEAGIVHRDVKPENIMLRPDGYIKILDFGIAKLTEAYAAPLDTSEVDHEAETVIALTTETGVVIGTTSYMSPEQARGQKIDARTDLFSLGVVLYEMIAGVSPFKGPTSADVLAAILAREPQPLTSFASDVPEALDWIIAKTLRKDRAERYQTAKELLGDMRSLKHRLEFEEELKRSMGSGVIGVGRIGAPDRTSGFTVSPAPHTSQSHRVIDSLAVLPLVNTLADPGMDYFSDGVTESIINALSQLSELHVMAWSTVSRYKNRQVDPREVGRDLGVRAVLAWRVVQFGERLVIKTELVDARDGSHLWGEAYSCDHSEIFDVETKISSEISEKLLLRLTAEERKRLEKRYTDNTEAYHAYLKGRHFWNKRTDEGVRQAIEFFKQAIDTDPSYAQAYAGLADSYLILGAVGVSILPPKEAMPKAREAASRALEIDETLAEAHAPLAYSLMNYYWDWSGAEREFKRCLELKPGYATAHHWYGFSYLVVMGQVDEGIKEIRRAFELDPLSLPISSNIGLLLYLARKYDQAIDQLTRTLELDQDFVYSHWQRALVYEQKGMYEEAIAGFEKAISLSGRGTLPVALLGHAYAISGRRDEALAVIDQLNELSKRRYVPPYRVATIYVGLGEKEEAFRWLDRAYKERDGWMVWLNLDPVLDPIRSDKRFKQLLKKVGLADASPRPSPRRASTKAITSLAILPLVNNCDDPGMDYFSDGVTESIINTLAQLPRLRVVARGSVFRYKGLEADPLEVGRELGVQAVLTGRVRQTENSLVVAVELTDVAGNSQLWGEHYNKKLSDIFEVQEEIAKEITEKLRLKLSRKEKGRINKRQTDSVEAYQAYLKGRYFWNKRTVESLNRGIEYFKQAIDLDPSYASAYAGLSDSYTLLVVREALTPEEGFAKAKAAAAMALKIDEEFAEAHASLGHAMLHNWEWDDAERELKRAIALNPGYPSAHHWYSEHLTAMGRCDESIAELKLAERLDPLSLVISADLGRAFYYGRDYDQVLKQEARTLEMDSNFWLSHINLGRSYTQKGMHAEAINGLERAREVSPGNTEVLSFLGFAYAAAGESAEALETLLELEEQSKLSYVPSYHLAIVHAGLGQKDQAFEWLERAFESHAVDLFTLKVEPMFDSLRSDQRFHDLLRRVGLALAQSGEKPDGEKSDGEKSDGEKSESSIRPALIAIAVLPFKPISAEGRDEYLELGMADALITRLSNLKQVVVRPTSAIRKYSELETDAVTAGRELRVESVIEGCIQRLSNRFRVTVRLLRVADGTALWASKFDEEFTDIFAVQDSISEKAATALALRLTEDERERLTKRYTENTAAYQLYLKGRYYWNKKSEESLSKAVECFNQAIDIDPNYALAYAGLADCYTKLGDVGITAIIPREAFARARAAASRALEIDSSLAEIHASLGHLDMHLLRWDAAERDFKRAIELNPNYATAHHWYAYYMAFHCRFDEALEKIEVALRLDPLSLSIIDSVGEFLYFARRNHEAIKQFRKTLEMDPNFLATLINLGRAYEQSAMFSEAEAQFLHARQITAESIDALAALGHTYALSGNTTAALEVLAQMMELSKERYVSPYDIALIHTALGDTDEAFRWLATAYDECAEWIIYTNADPRLDPLRTDSRFNDLLERLGFASDNNQR
jgi:serine/threonine-protein kinase